MAHSFGKSRRGSRDLMNVKCFKCDDYGHYQSDCPLNRYRSNSYADGSFDRSRRGKRNSYKSLERYTSQKSDHPKLPNNSNTPDDLKETASNSSTSISDNISSSIASKSENETTPKHEISSPALRFKEGVRALVNGDSTLAPSVSKTSGNCADVGKKDLQVDIENHQAGESTLNGSTFGTHRADTPTLSLQQELSNETPQSDDNVNECSENNTTLVDDFTAIGSVADDDADLTRDTAYQNGGAANDSSNEIRKSEIAPEKSSELTESEPGGQTSSEPASRPVTPISSFQQELSNVSSQSVGDDIAHKCSENNSSLANSATDIANVEVEATDPIREMLSSNEVTLANLSSEINALERELAEYLGLVEIEANDQKHAEVDESSVNLSEKHDSLLPNNKLSDEPGWTEEEWSGSQSVLLHDEAKRDVARMQLEKQLISDFSDWREYHYLSRGMDYSLSYEKGCAKPKLRPLTESERKAYDDAKKAKSSKQTKWDILSQEKKDDPFLLNTERLLNSANPARSAFSASVHPNPFDNRLSARQDFGSSMFGSSMRNSFSSSMFGASTVPYGYHPLGFMVPMMVMHPFGMSGVFNDPTSNSFQDTECPEMVPNVSNSVVFNSYGHPAQPTLGFNTSLHGLAQRK